MNLGSSTSSSNYFKNVYVRNVPTFLKSIFDSSPATEPLQKLSNVLFFLSFFLYNFCDHRDMHSSRRCRHYLFDHRATNLNFKCFLETNKNNKPCRDKWRPSFPFYFRLVHPNVFISFIECFRPTQPAFFNFERRLWMSAIFLSSFIVSILSLQACSSELSLGFRFHRKKPQLYDSCNKVIN